MLFFLGRARGGAGATCWTQRGWTARGAWNAAALHVTLPLLGPTFGFVVPVALLNALTQVDHVVIDDAGRPVRRHQPAAVLHLSAGRAELRPWRLAAAATVVSVAALLALALVSLRTAERFGALCELSAWRPCTAPPAVLLWSVPFAWMVVASAAAGLPGRISRRYGPPGPFSAGNIVEAWEDGSFPLWYLNTVLLCAGILLVQLRDRRPWPAMPSRGCAFPASASVFAAFLLQLLLVPSLLIVPNLQTLSWAGLYDTLPGVAAPYLASAFGVFLMRQTFRAIPPRLRGSGACWTARLAACRSSRLRVDAAGSAWASQPSPSSPSRRIGTSSCGR